LTRRKALNLAHKSSELLRPAFEHFVARFERNYARLAGISGLKVRKSLIEFVAKVEVRFKSKTNGQKPVANHSWNQ
jgi:hypothetical protein